MTKCKTPSLFTIGRAMTTNCEDVFSRSVNGVFIIITFYLFSYLTFCYPSIFIILKTEAMLFIPQFIPRSCDMYKLKCQPAYFLDTFLAFKFCFVFLLVCLPACLLAF